LKVLFFSFLSFVCPSIGVANFFCKFWRRENEFAFFSLSQKIVRRKTEREERRAEERLLMKRERTEEEKKREFVRLMCVSLFSFKEECRYTTNNK